FIGPEALLSGLRKTFEFNQKEAGTLGGRAVWIIRGKWRRTEPNAASPQPVFPPPGPLPPYVPSIVAVWIGQEDGWPYQVKLEGRAPSALERKKQERQVGPDGRPVAKPIAMPIQEQISSILLVYSDVVLNQPIESGSFDFQPPPEL